MIQAVSWAKILSWQWCQNYGIIIVIIINL